MFFVDYAEGHAGLPRLLSDDYLVPRDTRDELEFRTILDTENERIIVADNLDTVVEFGCFDKHDKKMWSSREGIFNTNDGSTAIIQVVCGCHIQHYHLSFVRRLIAEGPENIEFFRVTQFENREVYYIPYHISKKQQVLDKLRRTHGVFDILEIVDNMWVPPVP